MFSLNILFPVLNEEKRLKKGIEETCSYMEDNFQCPYCLTIVDNGSTDRTEQISRELCEKYTHVRYLRLQEKGVGMASRAGVKNNDSDIVGYMDVDLSTDISHLKDMYHIFERDEAIQIVNASRLNKRSHMSGRKWYRNITSYGLAFLIRGVFSVKSTDVICGFKFFRRETAEKLIAQSSVENGWFFIIEMLIRAERGGMKIYELPVTWQDDPNTTVNVKKLVMNYLKNIVVLKKTLMIEDRKDQAGDDEK